MECNYNRHLDRVLDLMVSNIEALSQNNQVHAEMIARVLGQISDSNARTAAGLEHIARAITHQEQTTMALKATDQALIAEIHRNSDIASATTKALTAFGQNVADLTQKLADAVAGSDAADDEAVKAALAELKANNDAQAAAIPAVAAAVANTDPTTNPDGSAVQVPQQGPAPVVPGA